MTKMQIKENNKQAEVMITMTMITKPAEPDIMKNMMYVLTVMEMMK